MKLEEENSGYDGLYAELREALMLDLGRREDAGDEEIRDMIDALIFSSRSARGLSPGMRALLAKELFDSVRRLDILQELIDDKSVTEIMVNGPDSIFIEREGSVVKWNRGFSSKEKLEDVIQQIVGRVNRVVNEQNPIADARLADGSRVNAVIAPVALDGPILTIRQFPEKPYTMDSLIENGSISREAASFLETMVAAGYSIIISGGTSAGKTTFLNALSNYIPGSERVITIEDNAELQIQGISNLVRLEAKNANFEGNRAITIRDLIKSALRMRPDRIIVGEVRSGEAVDMLQAFNTGHDGSLCTIHSNGCADCVSRLATMVLMAFPLPLEAIYAQIASGVDLIVHLGRIRDHSRRVLEIAETDGLRGNTVAMHSLYRWNDHEMRLEKTGELTHRLKLELSGLAP